MGETRNVIVGVGILEVKNPDTHRAEWSEEKAQSGTYSVKLAKPLGGNYCSTHVEFVPRTAGGEAIAVDIQDFVGAAGAGDWGWSHYRHGIAGSYWEQLELHFEDPLTTGWVDVTVQVDVAAVGGDAWVAEPITGGATESYCFFGGWTEDGGSFSNWNALEIDDGSGATTDTLIETADTGAATNVQDWVLTRVRLELWETSTERYVYVDDVIIEGVTYTFEPGGSTIVSALRLSSNFTEVGYTDDGVTVTYTADTFDVEVEEETFPIDRVIIKETVEVTCNMAESSLFNMDKAMAGSLLSGNILKLGGGAIKKISLQVRSVDPTGDIAAIQMPSCTATGSVGMPYKKGEKTVVPVTFQALKTAGHPAVTIVYNVA